jgi:predicted RNA binding protein YcfA (HicA-like mRNA interferase family)
MSSITGIEKLVEKFLTDKTHITVEDCHRLLTGFGYSLHKKGGSHQSYHKKGEAPVVIIIPKNTKYVKPGYVMKIIKRFNMEGKYDI